MGKTRSFRLTKSNEMKLKELKDKLGLDNENMTFNRIIEDYHDVVIYRPIIKNIKELLTSINNL